MMDPLSQVWPRLGALAAGLSLCLAAPHAMVNSTDVRPCQIGYLPGETHKIAVVAREPAGAGVVRDAAGREVLRVTAGGKINDANSGDALWPLDLSALVEPGVYTLDVPGVGVGPPFLVANDAFSGAFRTATRAFTGQRCGTDVSLAPDFPQYRYDACHTESASFHPSSGKSGTLLALGGWHDAGDYNRYSVNSGISTGTLLWAYELNADKLERLNLDLPESGNGTPDFLNEVRWNLNWMLTMQDPADGGVWHKETGAQFCGFVMPPDDRREMLVVGTGAAPFKVTAATADLAAVAATAARVYRPFDAAFADKCLAAARAAFAWCEAHPDSNYQEQPAGIGTGAYGDGDAGDEMLWAAAELFRTTGEAAYNRYFLDHHARWSLSADAAPGWPSVGDFGLYAYALTARPEADAAVRDALRDDALSAADGIVDRMGRDGYRCPLTPADYTWGSNGTAANYGLMLRVAGHLSPEPKYADAAMDCLHYLFGRNAFATSFVTQLGARWPMHPHHRPSAADGVEQPWPGMLVGGPNAGPRKDVPPFPEGLPPAKRWLDDEGRYELNEIAINWQAPLVFLLAEALPGDAPKPAAAVGHGTFPVIEASFTLRVIGNPFDFEQNDVKVAVAAPDGKSVVVPAFFDGGDTWRVRHAPAAPGQYAVKGVTLNGRPVDVGGLKTPGFDVAAAAPGRGFVRLTDSKMNFVFDDGEPYYPVGYNLAWHHTGEPKMPPLVESIRRMGEARVNWTRIWMNHWDAKNLDWIEQPNEIAQPKLGELSLPVARHWDAILNAAADSGVYLQMVLQHHGQYSTGADANWQINPWNKANGGWLDDAAAFFTDAKARSLTKKKYRYILARYGAMPSVMAWELFNEVQFTDGFKSDLPSVAAWHKEMADFLREHDPYSHLITTSSVVEVASLWPAMDYYQAHTYPPDLLAAIGTLDARKLDRAYFYGEIGASASGDDPSAVRDTVHKILWGGLMSNASGVAQYWYWYLAEPGGALPQYAAAQKFLDLSGLRGRYDLKPVEAVADTGRRGPLRFGPGIDWAPSLTTQFDVKPSGLVEGLGGMSAFLQGDGNRDLFPQASFAVDMPSDGTFAVRFDQLSPAGAKVEVSVDGRPTSAVALDPPANGGDAKAGQQSPSQIRVSIEVPLTAGKHAVLLRNGGKDWVHISAISLTDYAPEVAVLAKGDDAVTVLWAYRRTPAGDAAEPLKATLTVPGRKAGERYEVTWVDTATGEATGTATAEAGADGVLSLQAPPIRHDLAAVVRRAADATASRP